MHTFIRARGEDALWTVGHYTPSGQWMPISDHDSPAKAAAVTAFLNGGVNAVTVGPDDRVIVMLPEDLDEGEIGEVVMVMVDTFGVGRFVVLTGGVDAYVVKPVLNVDENDADWIKTAGDHAAQS